MGPGALDLSELEDGADADKKSETEDKPPQPSILFMNQIRRSLHYKRPLGQRESKTRESPISGSDSVTEAHEEKEADPVEEEGGDESSEEDKVIAEQSNIFL